MSSFVISKKEYVKAAGLVAGLAKAYNIWFYDFQEGRNSNADDYRRRFIECYQLNAESVQKQYNDPEPEKDPGKYQALFAEYYNKGLNSELTYGQAEKVTAELLHFFRSVLYQVEDQFSSFAIGSYFNQLTALLCEAVFTSKYAPESWGSIEI